MRPLKIKDRCTKKKLKKCEEVARTYDKIQTAYADVLDKDKNIEVIKCNVLLENLEDGEFTTDFLCTKTNGDLRQKSIPERLIALQDIYQIFIPNKMSREIYSKLYLSLLRSIQKKQSIFAVRQYHENSKMIRQKSYESIIGGSDSFTIIGPSGIGKSSAVSRAINILTEVPVLNLGNTND